jgi:DNA-binding NarL/FixJ family response regulator/tRNA A-37 threonylcarbamoyl transferase component Bud32
VTEEAPVLTESIRVMVVDDQPVARDGVRADLESAGDFRIVAEAADGDEAILRAREVTPDVILMDLRMPTMSGVDATRRIVQDSPQVKVLMFSASAEEADVLEAVKAGAAGYILKSSTRREVADSVRRVHRGEPIFTPSLAGLVLGEFRRMTTEEPKEPLLTSREADVLKFVAGSHEYRDIASRLSISVETVQNEMRSVLARLQRQYAQSLRPRRTRDRDDSAFLQVHLRVDELPKKRRRPSGEPPPLPRSLGTIGKWWLVLGVALIATWILVATKHQGVAVLREDRAIIGWFSTLPGGLKSVMRGLNWISSIWTIRVLGWGCIVALVANRRWRHVVAFLGSILAAELLASAVTLTPRGPVVFVASAAKSLPPANRVAGVAVTLIGMAYGLAPAGRWRRRSLIGATLIVAAVGVARVGLAVDLPSRVMVGVILGVVVPLLAFRVITPDAVFPVTYRRGRSAHLEITGTRDQAIRRGLRDQLGFKVVSIEPFGLEGSGASTPLRLRLAGEPETFLFGKLYALNHVRSDRWYKIARTILYGTLEDEKSFTSVRRLAEYEDYMLRILQDYGLPTPAPHGIVEITPEREYLIVTEFLDDAWEIGEVEVDEEVMKDALSVVRALWDAGLAHRDIKPSNVMLRRGRIYLIDAAFCQFKPTPWRQAVDLANMMLVLALRATAEPVYRAALRLFEPEEVAEAFAATRGVTMPSQLRAMLRKDGRDLLEEFRVLVPRRPPITIQRWSVRRILLTVEVLGFLGALIAIVATQAHRAIL